MAETKNWPKLNFPAFRFRVSEAGGQLRVWDELRGAWLVLTPEEWVRRHVVRVLTERMEVPERLISQEYPVCVQGMSQRADVVVCGRDGGPLMLVECKAPGVEVDAKVYAQAVRYNAVVGARYIMITNGLRHFVYEARGDGEYARLDIMPELKGFI